MLTYHELRAISPEKARECVRKVLVQSNGNVSQAASILCILPKTVRRARDGTLEDLSRRPLNCPHKTDTDLEALIIATGKSTGYRYRRLTSFMKKKFGLTLLSEDTVKAILKRNAVRKKIVRTKNHRSRPLYDYEHLAPFSHFQLDTKHVLDFNALPADVYSHIQKYKLPLYEWNIIDVITKTRFTAYSHSLGATFGWFFIFFILHWLRAHHVTHRVFIQADNGMEFCANSKRKEEELNMLLAPLNATFTSIPAGKKYLQGIVENSHLQDDHEFLSIHPPSCRSTERFILKAQQWQDTWNTARESHGIGMEGRTPQEKFLSYHSLISSHIFTFPVLHLDSVLESTGSYVPTTYHFSLFMVLQVVFFLS